MSPQTIQTLTYHLFYYGALLCIALLLYGCYPLATHAMDHLRRHNAPLHTRFLAFLPILLLGALPTIGLPTLALAQLNPFPTQGAPYILYPCLLIWTLYAALRTFTPRKPEPDPDPHPPAPDAHNDAP